MCVCVGGGGGGGGGVCVCVYGIVYCSLPLAVFLVLIVKYLHLVYLHDVFFYCEGMSF